MNGFVCTLLRTDSIPFIGSSYRLVHPNPHLEKFLSLIVQVIIYEANSATISHSRLKLSTAGSFLYKWFLERWCLDVRLSVHVGWALLVAMSLSCGEFVVAGNLCSGRLGWCVSIDGHDECGHPFVFDRSLLCSFWWTVQLL